MYKPVFEELTKHGHTLRRELYGHELGVVIRSGIRCRPARVIECIDNKHWLHMTASSVNRATR